MKPRTIPVFRLLIAYLVLVPVALATRDAQTHGPRHETSPTLDLSQPVPRDLAMEALHQMAQIPAEDLLEWEQAVAAGRIPPNAVVLREFLASRASKVDWETIGPPPSITLPNGERTEGIPLELLGPNLGANVTQEDLNTFIVDIWKQQKELNQRAHERAKAEFKRKYPGKPVEIDADDFQLSTVRSTPSMDDSTIPMSLQRDGMSEELHVDRTPILNGRHIRTVRKALDVENRQHLVLEFNEEGAQLLARATRDARGKHLALIVGGKLLSAPLVHHEITGGSVQITGLTPGTVDRLVNEWGWRTEAQSEAPREP